MSQPVEAPWHAHRYIASGLVNPRCGQCGGLAKDHPVVGDFDYAECALCHKSFPADKTVRFLKDGRSARRCRPCAGFALIDLEAEQAANPIVVLANRLEKGLITQDDYEEELSKLL